MIFFRIIKTVWNWKNEKEGKQSLILNPNIYVYFLTMLVNYNVHLLLLQVGNEKFAIEIYPKVVKAKPPM